jgi:hypothetical protein
VMVTARKTHSFLRIVADTPATDPGRWRALAVALIISAGASLDIAVASKDTTRLASLAPVTA